MRPTFRTSSVSPLNAATATSAGSTFSEAAPIADVSPIRPLPSPRELRHHIELDAAARRLVESSRRTIANIIHGRDHRLLVIVGPCSIHDRDAAYDYAARLAEQAQRYSDRLFIVMRVYGEKPRTTVGWKGLVNDPDLDGSGNVNRGLALEREVFRDVLSLGLPTATEFVEPLTTSYIHDAVSWGAIGARTVESQVHRQLASSLPIPIGFKNATDGSIQQAIDAIRAASVAHRFVGVDDDGHVGVVSSLGNADGHVILRGGISGPNYGTESVLTATDRLTAAGLHPAVTIDASHGNSGKDHIRQRAVVADIAERIAEGEPGINGVMMESFLVPGKQAHDEDMVRRHGKGTLAYGQSITDACMGWDATTSALDELARAVHTRGRDA
ncbi:MULTISPECIES: 3-deoxy-7-phosphoheptulonate synthase [Corynebacterium]|uniref:3-deoxy-7-phosphoheptulonate synthase n=1 Tax=Corynebacterium TaxID=1716 RepID=UPI00195C8EE2|nr:MULTISPECIES: 3-deoxy-7-phosphoheptulonate synthase [Corynebacterium]MDN8625229.1 3-deoxy-7-phosphoheptulonate synthase [Corynebacterium kroppenstedtii]QRQ65021.1 3-deoxy-7-phosphoheptulonate synthase [Corynebacterium kroppenstedtii]